MGYQSYERSEVGAALMPFSVLNSVRAYVVFVKMLFFWGWRSGTWRQRLHGYDSWETL